MQIELSLKTLGGVDLMSLPALQDWLAAIIRRHVAAAMTFPAAVDVSFTSNDVPQLAAEHPWPRAVATATLARAHLPRSAAAACMPRMSVAPAAALRRTHGADAQGATYPLVIDPRKPETLERWQLAFPLFDRSQVRAPSLVVS